MKKSLIAASILCSVARAAFVPDVIRTPASLCKQSVTLNSSINFDEEKIEAARREIKFADLPRSIIDKRIEEPDAIEIVVGRLAMVGWVAMLVVEATTGMSEPEQVMTLLDLKL